MKKQSLIISVVFVFILFIGVIIAANVMNKSGKTSDQITTENANEKLDRLYNKVNPTIAQTYKGQIDLNPADVAESLPDISKYPISVKPTTQLYVEIFSSPEKAGTGVDGWLNGVAEAFNKSKPTVNGKPVSVQIRNISSGIAKDYIVSGKYIPDGFTPSNEFWGEMVKASNTPMEMITDRLVGNVAGIVISRQKHQHLIDTYGAVNIATVTEAISNNEFSMGYTDPFASSTGLNFLVTALNTFDPNNLLSETATVGFETFQANVPFTANTTIQMRDAAKSGVLDGFVMEYQTYINTAELASSYEFTPFGVRHDSPLYAVGDVSKDKKEILKLFADFVTQDKYKQDATKNGFNGHDNYEPELTFPNGGVLTSAQKLWKEKKNAGKPVVAVFVTDVSGSMAGESLNRLKQSLLAGQKYLGRDNSIGLVSYADKVTINLPIAKFDTNQQSMFVGAVESLQASGGTATFNGVIVAMKMLQEQVELDANIQPIIFLLSDGETNGGHSLKDIRSLVETFGIPIYTIGYNANIEALQNISSINEASSINADTDDVVYKISNLLNVQM